MNDTTVIWGALLLVGITTVFVCLMALRTHSAWRKRVETDRWRGRRRVAGISLFVYEFSLLALVGALDFFAWHFLVLEDIASQHVHLRLSILGLLDDTFIFMRFAFLSACISATTLFGVVALPVAGRTESPEVQKKIRHKSRIVY